MYRASSQDQDSRSEEKKRENTIQSGIRLSSKKGHPKNMVHFPDKTCHTRVSTRVVHKRTCLSTFFVHFLWCQLKRASYGYYIKLGASFLLIFKHYACLEVFCEQVSKQLEPQQPHEFSPHGPLSFMLTGSFLPCFSLPLAFSCFLQVWGKFFLCSQ